MVVVVASKTYHQSTVIAKLSSFSSGIGDILILKCMSEAPISHRRGPHLRKNHKNWGKSRKKIGKTYA